MRPVTLKYSTEEDDLHVEPLDVTETLLILFHRGPISRTDNLTGVSEPTRTRPVLDVLVCGSGTGGLGVRPGGPRKIRE